MKFKGIQHTGERKKRKRSCSVLFYYAVYLKYKLGELECVSPCSDAVHVSYITKLVVAALQIHRVSRVNLDN